MPTKKNQQNSFVGASGIVFILFFALLQLMLQPIFGGETELKSLMKKMEEDVLDFAEEVERVYGQRCSSDTLKECFEGSYDDCLSEYPAPSCPGGDQLTIRQCGDGQSCGGLFDYTVSAVRLPSSVVDGPNNNPTNPKVIETVCYTRQIDEWIINKYFDDLDFWSQYGVDAPQMHFGAHEGTHRIFPARHSASCGWYDPRERPWYIAASSGPRNIVLVLDTSGSMYGILNLMKEAASSIVKTLTVGDRVSIVEFKTEAKVVAERTDGRMYVATAENKRHLLKAINSLQASGNTNFFDAFDMAFETLDNTIEQELHSPCNSAILFLTDGEMTEPTGITGKDVMELVNKRKDAIEAKTNHPVFLFTYSLGDKKVHTLPQQIACSTEQGVWSKIEDKEELVTSMSSYYKLFALGLGEGGNEDFTAWVEPYNFATGGVLGTTVSAPVYDRTVSPPLLIGVVGFDFTLAAMDKALGVAAGSTETLEEVVAMSTAKCPTLNLSLCELESFRRLGAAGDEALCTENCTSSDFVGIEPDQCPSISDYPSSLWNNVNKRGKSFKEKVCCKVGENKPSGECPAGFKTNEEESSGSGLSTGAIVGIVVAGFAVWAALIWWARKRGSCVCKTNGSKHSHRNSPPHIATSVAAIPPPSKHETASGYRIPPPENPSFKLASAPVERSLGV